MFDKELFISLCKKYGVELSETAEQPMIKDGKDVHSVTEEDINRIFMPCLAYFEYSSDKMKVNIASSVYYVQEGFAVAC